MNKVFTTSIIICMMLIASIALGKDIYVDDDADPGGNGSPEYPFQYIQDGIDVALPGDRVLVAEGTYEENITLNKGSVKVIGDGADVTTITASSGDVVTADGVGFRTSISRFTIDGQGSNNDGIYCYSSSPTISNVTISNTGDDGIYCYSSSPAISNMTISNAGGNGIYCNDSSSPTISDITISNAGNRGIYCDKSLSTISNVTISNAGGGIYCYSSSLTISDVTISDARYGGIYCENSSPTTISDVTISGAGGDGIYCYSSSPTISDVTISNAGDNGIDCYSSSPAISNCEIRDSVYNGIKCNSSSSPIIRESTITCNNFNGISIYGGCQPDIGTEAEPGLNEIFNNGNYDVYSTSTAEIKAELNWWGQAPPNPLFFSGNIDYDPWLTEPPNPRTGSINGHVKDAVTEEPIPKAIVIAINAGTKEKTIAFTNNNGKYEIPALAPGGYLVICIKKIYKAGIKKAKVNPGAGTQVDFMLNPKPPE